MDGAWGGPRNESRPVRGLVWMHHHEREGYHIHTGEDKKVNYFEWLITPRTIS